MGNKSSKWTDGFTDVTFTLPANPTIDDFLLALKNKIRSLVKICTMDYSVGNCITNSTNQTLKGSYKTTALPEDRLTCSFVCKRAPLPPIASQHLTEITLDLDSPYKTILPIQNIHFDLPKLKALHFEFEQFNPPAFIPHLPQTIGCIELPEPLLSSAGDIGLGMKALDASPDMKLYYQDTICNRLNEYNIYSPKDHPEDREPYTVQIPLQKEVMDTDNQIQSS